MIHSHSLRVENLDTTPLVLERIVSSASLCGPRGIYHVRNHRMPPHNSSLLAEVVPKMATLTVTRAYHP
jgi:hypothetical protein